jgi:hypothetical protein
MGQIGLVSPTPETLGMAVSINAGSLITIQATIKQNVLKLASPENGYVFDTGY